MSTHFHSKHFQMHTEKSTSHTILCCLRLFIFYSNHKFEHFENSTYAQIYTYPLTNRHIISNQSHTHMTLFTKTAILFTQHVYTVHTLAVGGDFAAQNMFHKSCTKTMKTHSHYENALSSTHMHMMTQLLGFFALGVCVHFFKLLKAQHIKHKTCKPISNALNVTHTHHTTDLFSFWLSLFCVVAVQNTFTHILPKTHQPQTQTQLMSSEG